MKLTLDAQTLEIHLSALERLGAVRFGSTIRVPLEQILEVAVQSPPHAAFSLRLPGTHVPGLIKAGTYLSRHEGRTRREFWFVTGWRRAPLTLTLKDHHFDRLALSLDQAQEWAARISRALPSAA